MEIGLANYFYSKEKKMAFIKATERTLNAIRKADELKPDMLKDSSYGSFNGSAAKLVTSSNRLQISETAAADAEVYGRFSAFIHNDYLWIGEKWQKADEINYESTAWLTSNAGYFVRNQTRKRHY